MRSMQALCLPTPLIGRTQGPHSWLRGPGPLYSLVCLACLLAGAQDPRVPPSPLHPQQRCNTANAKAHARQTGHRLHPGRASPLCELVHACWLGPARHTSFRARLSLSCLPLLACKAAARVLVACPPWVDAIDRCLCHIVDYQTYRGQAFAHTCWGKNRAGLPPRTPQGGQCAFHQSAHP